MRRSWRGDRNTPVQPSYMVSGRLPLGTSLVVVCAVLTLLVVPHVWRPHDPAGTAAAGTASAPPSGGTDEAEVVLIPAGEFIMGYDKGGYDTLPVRKITLPAFYIDKYEVTNKRYKRFIDATGYKVPWSHDPDAASEKPYLWNWQKRMYPDGKGDDPVVLVSWEDAKTFCAWAGKRIPTEAEWEKAARGPNGNLYPWGNEWANGKANTSESGRKQTAPIGAFKEDVIKWGKDAKDEVYDLAGNVSEWVEDYFGPYPGNPLTRYEERNKYRVLRGGSWNYSHSIANGYHRQYALPHSQMPSFGFRCVKSADGDGGSPPRPQTR
jgi:formylglycine-generating enzyme required for sulfatase activity